MIKTNVIHRDDDPKNPHPKGVLFGIKNKVFLKKTLSKWLIIEDIGKD